MKNKFGATLLAGLGVVGSLSGIFAPVAAAAPVVSNSVATNQATVTNAINESGKSKITTVDWNKDTKIIRGGRQGLTIVCFRQIYPGERPPDWDTPKYPPYIQGHTSMNSPQTFRIPCGQFGQPS